MRLLFFIVFIGITGFASAQTSTVCWMLFHFADAGQWSGGGTPSLQSIPLCKGDTLNFSVSGAPGIGTYTISPSAGISITDTVFAKAFPSDTTTYTIRRSFDNVCWTEIKFTVNVITEVKLTASIDTAGCKGSSFQLNASSNVNNYEWQPSSLLFNSDIKNPLTKPLDTTTKFYVTSTLGRCKAQDSVLIKIFPYPTLMQVTMHWFVQTGKYNCRPMLKPIVFIGRKMFFCQIQPSCNHLFHLV